MLQFTRGVCFRVDVRYFLQLERALHRDRPHRPAPEEERMVLLREVLGEMLEFVVHLQRFFDRCSSMHHVRHELGFLFRAHPSLTGEDERDDQHREELRRERLGAGDADLGAGLGHHAQVGLPDHRAVSTVTDRE